MCDRVDLANMFQLFAHANYLGPPKLMILFSHPKKQSQFKRNFLIIKYRLISN